MCASVAGDVAEVGKGWHAFLLHTADYAEFCNRVADRFIHHLPDEPGEEDNGAGVPATVAAMHVPGLTVDASQSGTARQMDWAFQAGKRPLRLWTTGSAPGAEPTG
jgi:hypothetical protein